MRILHCIHSVNPASGGPVEFIRQSIAVQEKLGNRLDVVCMDDPSEPFVRDFPCTVYAQGPSYLSYGYSPRFVSWLKSNRTNYDVVIINGIWQYPALGTWLALRNTDTPYVLFPHGMLDPWFREAFPLKHIKKSVYWLLIQARILKDADAVLFTAEEERLKAAGSFLPYACKEVVLGYGTALPNGDSEAQKEIFLSRFPHLKGKNIILFLGRIHEKKGCDILLESASKLCKGYPDFHLVMAGPEMDSYGKRLRAKFLRRNAALAEQVTWTGMLQGDLKWGALHCAGALILPSHQENFGVAVAEALACSKPVLISDKVNIWREIAADGAGFVESDTLNGTMALIERWLRTPPEKRRTMERQAKQCFISRFEIDTIYDRFASLLSSRSVRALERELSTSANS